MLSLLLCYTSLLLKISCACSSNLSLIIPARSDPLRSPCFYLIAPICLACYNNICFSHYDLILYLLSDLIALLLSASFLSIFLHSASIGYTHYPQIYLIIFPLFSSMISPLMLLSDCPTILFLIGSYWIGLDHF